VIARQPGRSALRSLVSRQISILARNARQLRQMEIDYLSSQSKIKLDTIQVTVMMIIIQQNNWNMIVMACTTHDEGYTERH